MPYASHAVRRFYDRAEKPRASNDPYEVNRVVAVIHAEMSAQKERDDLWRELLIYAKAGEMRETANKC
jgi:hypothetical protein